MFRFQFSVLDRFFVAMDVGVSRYPSQCDIEVVVVFGRLFHQSAKTVCEIRSRARVEALTGLY
jgi:hypothetical protein